MGTITKLSAFVGGTEYDLSDRVAYIHTGNDGWGMPPVERITERGPYQHGQTDLGFRLQPRQINLVLNALSTNNAAAYFTRRQELLYIFSPRNEAIKLRLVYPLGTREIECHTTNGLTLGSEDKQAFAGQKAAITLEAPDPTWYDPTTVSESFGIVVSSNQFTVPMSIPLNIGNSVLDHTKTINYTGTFYTYPTITIYGPVTDLVITNTTTDEKLDFTGVTIGSGKIYTIDTRYGYKTVKDETGANKIAELTNDSDLATFHLEHAPVASNGANTIAVTGTSATSATQVYFSFYNRYIGL